MHKIDSKALLVANKIFHAMDNAMPNNGYVYIDGSIVEYKLDDYFTQGAVENGKG